MAEPQDHYVTTPDGRSLAIRDLGEPGAPAVLFNHGFMACRLTGRPVPGVHAETPAGQITFGFSPDLNAAMGDALDAMLTWLQASYGVGKATALALASPVLDLRVTQVANQSWGVHALLPAGAIS